MHSILFVLYLFSVALGESAILGKKDFTWILLLLFLFGSGISWVWKFVVFFESENVLFLWMFNAI